MKFLSFLSDLGIISNTESNSSDMSLEQGQNLMNYTNDYKQQSVKNITLLQNTGIPGVNSIIESMDNRVPNISINDRNGDSISELEDNFNKKFSNYNTAHKLFVESSLNANKPSNDVQPYLGKNVTLADGLFSYVNDFGYTQKYSNDAWKKTDPTTCSSTPIGIDKDLYKKFKSGQDMGVGQPCGFAGKNIQNKKTSEYSWVDIKGQKHVYSNDIWKHKIASCNTEAIVLSSDNYDAIPSGSAMTAIDKCIQLEVDPIAWADLMKQNSELTNISTNLISELKKDTIHDNKIIFEKKNVVKNTDSTYYIRIISWSLVFLIILLITIDAISSETGGSVWHMVGIILSVGLFIIINFINVNSI